MSNKVFNVYERDVKANKNQLRKSGQIPGIIYGEFLDKSIPVSMKDSDLRRMLSVNNSGSIIEFNLDGKSLNCVVKEVQRNNLNEFIHIDLQYTKPNEVIKLKIPVRYVGQENLVPRRLVLETTNNFIEFQGSVEKIPEYIEINAGSMQMNDKVFIEDIHIPEGVVVLDNPKTLLCAVSPAM